MAEKWEVCKLGNDDYPDTKLRYAVIDETEDLISVHYREKDARKMAAVPRMLRALDAARRYIHDKDIHVGCICIKCRERKSMLSAIEAAIAAAKGE